VGFVSDLESGVVGVRCRLSGCGTELRSSDNATCIQDAGHAVLWTCVRTLWRTDLGPETLQLLRFDVQRHAKGLFDALFEPSAKTPKASTSDPDWSPLIEAQTQMLGGRVLRLVYRTRYEADHEAIEGRLVIPTSSGTLSITAFASADEVGAREKQALARHRAATKGSVPPGGRSPLAISDELQWDDEYPEHPLSRVRAALAWLTDEKGGGLTVEAPSADAYAEKVVLEEASSAIVAPPRFLRVPAGALAVPPTMGVLSRVVFAGDERPRTVEVWRLANGLRVTADFSTQLQRIVDGATAQWAQQGARDIDAKTMSANATASRAELIRYVRFVDAHGPGHAMQCWFTDTDGVVFRIAAAGPRYAPANDLWADMAQVTRSWKRLAGEELPSDAPPTSQKRVWWQFW